MNAHRLERTFDGERPRNIDLGGVVAFGVCLSVPLGGVLGGGPGVAQRELHEARAVVEDLRAAIDTALAATGEAR